MVDALDRVVGVVSKTDLLHRCVAGPLGSRPTSLLVAIGQGLGDQFEADALGVVSEFMNPDPVTALPDDSVGTVARRMLLERAHRAIIVDGYGHVQGIVTSLDMLRALAS